MKLFYGSIGVAASLAFFLLLYWGLSFNSSITMLFQNLEDRPVYLGSYLILTALAIILFGASAALLVYRCRKFGIPKLGSQAGSGAGSSFIGFAASACPVCGSSVLAALGVAGGLAAFPLGGLELKALSAGLLAVPVWLTLRDLKKLERRGGACEACPVPRDASFKKADRPWLLGVFGLIAVLSFVSWQMLRTEPFIAKLAAAGEGRSAVAARADAGNN